MEVCEIVGKITGAFINPALALFFAAGLLVFVYGLVEFLWGLGQGADSKQKGRDHMFYGLIGMFIMTAAIAIIKLIANIVGGSLPCGA